MIFAHWCYWGAALLSVNSMFKTSATERMRQLAKDSTVYGLRYEGFVDALRSNGITSLSDIQLREMFEVADRDKSGTLDYKEVEMLIRHLAIMSPELAEEVEDVFEVSETEQTSQLSANAGFAIQAPDSSKSTAENPPKGAVDHSSTQSSQTGSEVDPEQALPRMVDVIARADPVPPSPAQPPAMVIQKPQLPVPVPVSQIPQHSVRPMSMYNPYSSRYAHQTLMTHPWPGQGMPMAAVPPGSQPRHLPPLSQASPAGFVPSLEHQHHYQGGTRARVRVAPSLGVRP